MSKETFGNFLTVCRIRRGYKLREFADIIGISPYYLSLMESNARTNPNIKILGKIYKCLDLSKEEMEQLLDLYAKANGQVSADIIDYIMKNDDVRQSLRQERDKNSAQYWSEFIHKITDE